MYDLISNLFIRFWSDIQKKYDQNNKSEMQPKKIVGGSIGSRSKKFPRIH